MDKNQILLLVAFWLFSSLLSFLNGVIRRLHLGQWLLISLLLGPLAFVISLFLTGRGYRVSLFAKRETIQKEPEPRIPSDEELLAGKVAFKKEIVELKRLGKLDEAEGMLETLIDAIEEKARKHDSGVPHWYYEQLANIHRKKKKPKDELRVLERWASRPHADNPKIELRLNKRLAKLKEGTRRS
jgi:hypothetical protein